MEQESSSDGSSASLSSVEEVYSEFPPKSKVQPSKSVSNANTSTGKPHFHWNPPSVTTESILGGSKDPDDDSSTISNWEDLPDDEEGHKSKKSHSLKPRPLQGNRLSHH
jgi:hypothetical protein